MMWLQICPEVIKAGKSLCFATALVLADDSICARARASSKWVPASDQHEGGCDGRQCISVATMTITIQTNQEGSFRLLEVGQELNPDHEIGFEPVMVVQGCLMAQRRHDAPTAWRFR
jgi:hypothetical protein